MFLGGASNFPKDGGTLATLDLAKSKQTRLVEAEANNLLVVLLYTSYSSFKLELINEEMSICKRPFRMQGKHICITGASSGIGRALAEYYAGPGVRLSILARSYKKLMEVKARCEKMGAVVNIIAVDVCDRYQMQRQLSEACHEQAIDLLIINAGISQTQAAEEAKEMGNIGDDWQMEARLVDVHMHGMLNSLHPVLSAMRQRRAGQVVLMASLNALVIIHRSAIYGAVKTAILSYGLALRAKLAEEEIKVNVICPGWVKSALTDLNNFSMPGIMSGDRAAAIIAKGVAKNKAVVGFPWKIYWPCLFYQALPAAVKLWFSKRIG